MKYFLLISLLCLSCPASSQNFDVNSIPVDVQEKIKKENPKLLQVPTTQRKLDALLKLVHKYSSAKKVEIKNFDKKPSVAIEKPPLLADISIEGVSSSEKRRLIRSIDLETGKILKQEDVENAAVRIKNIYIQEGFFNAEISARTKKVSNSEIQLEFVIQKNKATVIDKVKISSKNERLNKDLEEELEDFLGDELNLGKLDELRSLAENFLRKQRYLQAKVSDPKYELNENAEKASILIDISNPQKYRISFFGNRRISKNKLIKELNLDERSSLFGLDVVSEMQNRILEIYKSEAFPKATVKVSEIDKSKYKILRVEIKEGPLVRIAKWHIRGNYSDEASYYVDKIEELGSSPIQAEKFVEKDLKKVISNLNIFLQNQGFLGSNTELERVHWINDSYVEVYLYLDEGPLTILNQVKFEGLKSFDKQTLLEVIDLKEGGPLNLNKIETSISQIRNFFLDKAFLEFQLENQGKDLISYFDQNKKADLILKINEGDRIEVRNIIISGTELTKNIVVSKSLAFEKGDFLGLEEIRESETNLQRLGIFSRVDIRPLPANNSKRPILVKVTERNPGVFTFGPGITDESGGTLRGFSGVVYKNLAGSAKVVQARLEIQKKLKGEGFLENRLTLSYLEPFLFGERLKGRTDLSFSQDIDILSSDDTDTFIKETKEINFNLEKDFNRHFKFGWKLWGISGTRRFEIDRKQDQEKLQIASLGPFLEFDYRDHPFTPKKGTFTRFNLEYASPGLESSEDIHFIRSTAAFNHYIPLTQDNYFVLAYSLRGGYVENVGDPGALSIPQDKMFFLGGRSTIRGFELSDIPKDSDISSLTPTGKNIYYVTDKSYFGLVKVELRFPIYKDFGAALFYDGGIVDIPEINIEDRYRHSAGIGFRFYTPVGPVSLEYGLKLDRKDGEDPGRVHFSIGAF